MATAHKFKKVNIMVDFVQKQVLDASSFSNANTNAADAIKVRVDASSVVGAAIANAVASATIADATTTTKGKVALAASADYPQATNDVDATTPAYVTAATSAIVAGKVPVNDNGGVLVGYLLSV